MPLGAAWPPQRELYRNLLTRNYAALAAASAHKGGVAGVAKLRNLVMELRKCCNHPYLFGGRQEAAGAAAAGDEQVRLRGAAGGGAVGGGEARGNP